MHADKPPTRILLVEENALIALDMKVFMESLGCLVLGPYFHLEATLRAAKELDYDLAFIDTVHERQLGYPVADIVAGRSIPFCFVSTHPENVTREKGYTDCVIPKPVDTTQVRRVLETFRADTMLPN